MNWERVCVGDVAVMKRGKYVTQKDTRLGNIPVILGGQEPAYYCDESNHDGPCVVISRSGASAGFVSYWDEPIFVTDGFLFEANERCDIRFLYYCLKSNQSVLGGMQNGSGIPHVQGAALKEFPISLPPLPEQRKIANELTAIDRKIALNRKRIATLEAMAKEIYDYWFVQFDFPDAHGRPYKSSGGAMVYNPDLKREIPKGWEVCRIGDHITANRGISYSTKNISSGNGVPMINLNSFNVDSSYKVKGIKMFDGEIPSTRRIAPYDLVMCNTQQTDLDPCKDIIGKSFLVPDIFEGTIVSSHHVTTIHVDDDNLKVYLNALFHTREFHAYIAGYASGTSIRGLNFLGVENCYIAVPHMPLLSKFANLALSCEKEKSRILRNQKMLQALRDFILPLLMNGQAKVG